MKEKKARKTSKEPSLHKSVSNTACSQNDFDRDVVKYFAHSIISLRYIEDPYFREILYKLNVKSLGLTIKSRRTLGHNILKYYKEQTLELKVKHQLSCIKYICTTIDIWSGRKRSFLGVTVY